MSEVKKERRKVTIAHAVTVQQPIIKCEDFSTWKRLLRVIAYVLRFIQSCKKSINDKKRIGPLSSEELAEAEEYWIRRAQLSIHNRIEKRELSALTPFKDGNGIIRVGG